MTRSRTAIVSPSLRQLPIEPDPGWFGWPARQDGDRVTHGFARPELGTPSLCGRATLRRLHRLHDRGRRYRPCARCGELWARQYPPRDRSRLQA